MKAKELAEILMRHPEVDVVFIAATGTRDVSKVIKCNLAKEKAYSFDKQECLLVDDNGKIRKSWLDAVDGQILNSGDFVFDDTLA